MTLHRMFDASTPPGTAYPGSEAVAGYIGPLGNTPHIWTLEEWLRFRELRQFPIWVGSGRTDGRGDGEQAAAAMMSLGWTAGPGPGVRCVLLDMETEINPAYVDGFAASVEATGYATILYESLSAVSGNPVRSGIWLADWDDIPAIPPLANVIGIQYKPDVPWDGTQVDLSAITDEMLEHAGYGPRH